jgi:hypothetical protein
MRAALTASARSPDAIAWASALEARMLLPGAAASAAAKFRLASACDPSVAAARAWT